MNEPTPRPERFIALFVAVMWAAVVFALDGLLAVLVDEDPIRAGVGPYYALIAFALTGVVVWLFVAGTAGSRAPVWGAIGAAASVYLVFLLVALLWGFPLLAQQAQSPFVIVAAVAAAVAVIGTWFAIRSYRLRHRRQQ